MLKRISKELSEKLDPAKVDTSPKWWEAFRIAAREELEDALQKVLH